MKKQLLILGSGLSLFLAAISPVHAVQPAPIRASDSVQWSEPVENPFDGKVVYDRNYEDDFILVTSWSKNGIRATYTHLRTELAGYHAVQRYDPFLFGSRKRRWLGSYTEQVPIYVRRGTESSPKSIQFSINGQLFTYEDGPIPADLATALVNAPTDRNMLIRLVWEDGQTRDVEIGKGTVRAWRKIGLGS